MVGAPGVLARAVEGLVPAQKDVHSYSGDICEDACALVDRIAMYSVVAVAFIWVWRCG